VKERFIITVEAEGRDGPPVIIRLRKFLKCALRSFGIRCVNIRPETPPDPPELAIAPTDTEARDR